MTFLFISRKNTHLRYYKKLCPQLDLDSKIHQMGRPILASITKLFDAHKVDVSVAVSNQLARKIAKQGLIWRLEIIKRIYLYSLTCWERLRVAKYLYLFEQEKPAVLVLWNGKKLPNRTLVIVAKELKIPIHYFENGLLPNTTSLDLMGVNYESCLSKDPSFFRALKFNHQTQKTTEKIIAREPIKKRSKFTPAQLPKRYIFVPFQVPHDTQIVCHSPWIKSMEELFEQVQKTAGYLIDRDLCFVFKEHPTWRKHYTSLYNKYPNAIFANGNNTVELIRKAEAVITINSTVGLESLQLDKKVITLGNACYNLNGLVQHAPDFIRLVGALNNLENWNFDILLKNNFFRYLKEIYCIPSSHHMVTSEHVEAVRKRLLGFDQLMTELSEKEIYTKDRVGVV